MELYTNEDLAVIGKVLAALGELGITLLLWDPVPIMWDDGPHRLYQFELTTRDDEPFIPSKFEAILLVHCSFGKFKPLFHSAEEYPDERSNFTRCYLTVVI